MQSTGFLSKQGNSFLEVHRRKMLLFWKISHLQTLIESLEFRDILFGKAAELFIKQGFSSRCCLEHSSSEQLCKVGEILRSHLPQQCWCPVVDKSECCIL